MDLKSEYILEEDKYILSLSHPVYFYRQTINDLTTDIQVAPGDKYIIKSSLDLLARSCFVCGDYVSKEGLLVICIFNSNQQELLNKDNIAFGIKRESLQENMEIATIMNL